MTFARSRNFAVIGQSYGQEGYDRTAAYTCFQEAVRRAIVADAAAVQTRLGGSPTIASGNIFQRRNYAVDGSAVLEKHTGSAGNYWLENDGTTAGPRLTTAVSGIGGVSGDWAVTVHSHGEQDAAFTTTQALAEEVAAGMAEIWAQIRTAQGAAYAVFVDILGPRFSANEFSEYLLRDAMLAAIAAGTSVFRGGEKYAVALDTTTHPTTDGGYAYLGAQTGRKAAHWLETGTVLSGPTIGSVTRTGNNVAVAVTVPAGGTLVKPSEPDFFGLFSDTGERISATGYSWSGNTLTITGASSPAVFRYPARSDRPHSVQNIVRLSDPADPLYAGEPGLPLESIATVTF